MSGIQRQIMSIVADCEAYHVRYIFPETNRAITMFNIFRINVLTRMSKCFIIFLINTYYYIVLHAVVQL